MEEEPTGWDRSTLRRPRRRWPVVVIALVALVGGFAFWFLRDGAPPQRPAPSATPTPAAATPPPAPPPVTQAAAEEARPLLESVSSNPLYRRGLGEGDVSRRFALVMDLLANGDSPRKPLAALAPKEPFSVARAHGKTVIAPASYARYDAFADAVASIDAAALARAYRSLHGVLEAAYRALGYPEASLDAVGARALRRILDAPVRDEVAVVPHEGQYVFAEDALEEQGDVEKHLLRMGPRNTRLIQAKARELEAALSAVQ
jgi:DUF3014 family protein